ncbi:hypothetical protein E3N88_39255 [Mikania micrantha]|uniref:Uncharacterized protein n=1 Tax=Mikania micrantha TaxID=192012 RepID=A0A5N6LWA7_9ASTR|nr:hypothetical protein E3N88_39255 [Mikania micrantha]
MMNMGENRARNGVTDCPKSRNKEKFQSMELLDSSRYATERLRTLRAAVGQNLSTAVRGIDYDYDGLNDLNHVIDMNDKTKMVGEGRGGGCGRGRGRPPKNKKQTEEVPVNNEETEVNIEGENEEEEIRLEPVVVKAISNEVRKILKDLLPPDRTKAEKETT